MTISPTDIDHARVLWDYHCLHSPVRRADFVLAMGSHDERVATAAAQQILLGNAPLLVTSGGFGKVTKDFWRKTEGERFAEIALEMGVSAEAIIIEPEASNTGENLTKTRTVLAARGLDVRSGIIVTKPYMSRRAFAAAARQWPEIEWQVTSPAVSFEDYPTEEVPLDRMINLMVGDLQRIDLYAKQGFQIPQDIPDKVWDSYAHLKQAGFDAFVIRDS